MVSRLRPQVHSANDVLFNYLEIEMPRSVVFDPNNLAETARVACICNKYARKETVESMSRFIEKMAHDHFINGGGRTNVSCYGVTVFALGDDADHVYVHAFVQSHVIHEFIQSLKSMLE